MTRRTGSRTPWRTAATRGSVGDPPVIVDIRSRFVFSSGRQAAKAARWMRRRYHARVHLAPVARRRRSGEWRVDARIPLTRFGLERLRLLTNELAEVAEARDGVLVTWDAVRPERGPRPSQVLHGLRRRTTLIVGTDVAIAVAGIALQAVALTAVAVAAFVVEGAIWISVGRRSAHH